jgi:CheY-like chemotaxis protein
MNIVKLLYLSFGCIKNYDKYLMNKLKILLAEDDALNQYMVRKVTSDFGFVLDIAENGQAAINKLNQNEYDLILMDIEMPVMNGYEATTYIRSQMGNKSNIPIIVVSGRSAVSETSKCLLAGANSYLPKPFNTREFLSELNTLFI